MTQPESNDDEFITMLWNAMNEFTEQRVAPALRNYTQAHASHLERFVHPGSIAELDSSAESYKSGLNHICQELKAEFYQLGSGKVGQIFALPNIGPLLTQSLEQKIETIAQSHKQWASVLWEQLHELPHLKTERTVE